MPILVDRTVPVSGMTCPSCEARINKRLVNEPGVEKVRADYRNGSLSLIFDSERVSWERIDSILRDMDYLPGVPGAPAAGGALKSAKQIAGLALLVLAVYLFAGHFGLLAMLNVFPEAESGMGTGMIFLIGLLTSAHCVAMCGGINLSQASLNAPRTAGALAAAAPTILYGTGRVVSYTVIGAAVGGMGSVVSLSSGGKGIVHIAAGVLMMLMGINLIGVFPWIRRLIPRLPASLSTRLPSGRGPFLVGLLNGFMPCGPLQSMQLFALSTGSPVDGALAMFAFAAGTLPLTTGLGVIASFLGRRFMNAAVRAGAVIVFGMGLTMLANGLALAGYVRPSLSGNGDLTVSVVAGGRQTLATRLLADSYQPVRVHPGIPLVWRITVEKEALNGCNNRFLIPEFDIERKLSIGENIVEFTPGKPGVYPYMCWMGMISSRIIVGDAEDDGVNPDFDASVLPAPDEEYDGDVPWL